MAAAAILDFQYFKLFNGRNRQGGRTAPACQISWKSVEPRPKYDDFSIFQDGGRPPSWICNACVGTTHEGHLVVFITVQNLVGMGGVVLIICTFFYFASLAWKRLFTPHNWEFLGVFDPLNGEQCEKFPKKAHPCASPRRLSHHAWNPSTCLTCRWVPQKKGINKNNFGYISPMCPEVPHGRICT